MLDNGISSLSFCHRDSQARDSSGVEKETTVLDYLCWGGQFLWMAQHANLDGRVQKVVESPHGFLVSGSMNDKIVDPDPRFHRWAAPGVKDKTVS